MYNLKKIVLVVTPLLLSGCFVQPAVSSSSSESSTSNQGQTTTNTNIPSSGTGISSTSFSSSSTSEEITDNSKIDYITLSDREMEVKVGKTTPTVIVTFHSSYNENEYSHDVTWSIKDQDIASVDQYGRVTGKKNGKTVLTCTTVEGNRQAYVTIYVYDDAHPIVKKWLKIQNNSDLELGSQLIIACHQETKAAGENDTGMYLHPENITLSSDLNEITSVGSGGRFILGDDHRGRSGYTLQIPEREDGSYLATTSTGKVSFYKTTNSSATLWDIKFDNEMNCWDIRSATTVDGWMMYNKTEGKFTTYESNEIEHAMYVVSLYKLSRV